MVNPLINKKTQIFLASVAALLGISYHIVQFYLVFHNQLDYTDGTHSAIHAFSAMIHNLRSPH